MKIYKKPLFWRLFNAYLIITLVSIALIICYAFFSFSRLYLSQTARDLENRGQLVAKMIKEQGSAIDPVFIEKLCQIFDVKTATRVTVLLPSGKVIGDSAEDPSSMDNHGERKEIRLALNGRTGIATRLSDTLQVTMMYVAIPLYNENREIIAIVRTAVPVTTIDNVIHHAYTRMTIFGLVIALAATLISLFISYKISSPIEELRRQFVANVSHELRTPITSIKGFIETLLDGAMNNPDDTERFLRIAGRQADRLNAIVEDLLTMSRLEQEEKETGIPLEKDSLCSVIDNAVQVCATKAKQKNTQIEIRCGEHLTASMNAPLLEQAIVNLIDNAIKFSPAGSKVWIEGRQEKKETVIHVRDNGCGIDARHIPHLFERFYRIDKARSRSLGGTGLGLAIVKHIVLLHKGRVYAESIPGEGSVFSIYLPMK